MRKDTSRSENPLLDSILTSPYTTGFIRKKAKQLIGRAGFTKSDLEDIQQDLYLKLLKHIAAFDANRAHENVFVKTIIERQIASILRDKKAKKRDHRRVCSLSLIVEHDDNRPIELGETVAERESNTRGRRNPHTQQELTELLMDVADFVDGLPDALRDLCKRLKRNSISQVACDQDIPRTTLNDRIRKLRQRFERAGLRDYL